MSNPTEFLKADQIRSNPMKRSSLNPEYKKRDPDQLRSFASEVTRVKQNVFASPDL